MQSDDHFFLNLAVDERTKAYKLNRIVKLSTDIYNKKIGIQPHTQTWSTTTGFWWVAEALISIGYAQELLYCIVW